MSESIDNIVPEFRPMSSEQIKTIAQSTVGKGVYWIESDMRGYTGISRGTDYMAPMVSLELRDEKGLTSIHSMSANSIKFIDPIDK